MILWKKSLQSLPLAIITFLAAAALDAQQPTVATPPGVSPPSAPDTVRTPRAADSTAADSTRTLAAILQDWTSRLTLSGRTYLRYSYETGESRKDYNEFAIDRLYVIFMFQIFERARLRYTLEAGDIRATEVSLSGGTLQRATSGNLMAVTKHLYFEYADFLGSGSFVRAGMHDLPWVPYEEDLWGYRMQGNVFADRAGYLTSSDLGIAIGGRIADKYGMYQASLVNGEGWRRSEAGRHKDWHLRLTLNPLAGVSPAAARFFLTGFRSSGVNDDISTGPATRTRTIGMLGYKNPGKFMLVGEKLWTTDPTSALTGRYPSLVARPGELADGEGHTVFGTISPAALGVTGALARFEVIGRLDNIDPDDQIADNDQERIIAGVSYQFHPQMRLLLDGERVRHKAGALRPNESRMLLQMEVRF